MKLSIEIILCLFLALVILLIGLPAKEWSAYKLLQPESAIDNHNYEEAVQALSQDTIAHSVLEGELNEMIISPEKYQDALIKLNKTLMFIVSNTHEGIHTREDALEFFRWMGKYIDSHYVYRRGTTFADGLVGREIDCDLRSYIYLAAARLKGVDAVHLVSSPGHAFIMWNGENGGSPIYWETTSPGGAEVNWSNSLYAKVMYEGFDYVPLSRRQVEASVKLHLITVLDADNDKAARLRLAKQAHELHPSPLSKVVLGSLLDDVKALEDYAYYTESDLANAQAGHIYYEHGAFEKAEHHYAEAIRLGSIEKTVTDRALKISSSYLNKVNYGIVIPSFRFLSQIYGRWLSAVDLKLLMSVLIGGVVLNISVAVCAREKVILRRLILSILNSMLILPLILAS